MVRLYIALAALAVAFIIYTLAQAIITPAQRVRTLPKYAWLLLIIFLPVLGGVLWLSFGKAPRAGGDSTSGVRSAGAGAARGVGQEDQASAVAARLAAESDARIEELEERLRQLDAEAAGAEPAADSADSVADSAGLGNSADAADSADPDNPAGSADSDPEPQ